MKLEHDVKYVHWYKEADLIHLKRDDWDAFIDTLDHDCRLEPKKRNENNSFLVLQRSLDF